MPSPRPRGAHVVVTCAAAALATSCFANQPRFVSVDPEYGYVDGCTDVTLSGSKLGTTATATVDGVDMPLTAATEDPDLPAWAQDVGFVYYGRTPAKADGEKGFVDVVMTVDGKALTLPEGFYYMACPGSVFAETVDPTDGVAAGGTVELRGCGLDPAAVTGRLLDDTGAEVATFPITRVCGNGIASFTVPTVADGTYWVELVHTDGSTWGGACVASPDTDGETASTDTADPCASLVTITVGGA